VFVDVNKSDLCMSFDDFKLNAEKFHHAVVWVVHMGGHIAFDIDKISKYCEEKNIILLEDCAHAHGSSWNSKRAGEWGDAGIYSFYATKTISTGEGGMLVSKHKKLIKFAKQFRNYGKPDFKVAGLYLRMSGFNAAIGVLETDRLNDIVEFKNNYTKKLDKDYTNRVFLPYGMIPGYYKYIIFDPIENSTGKVYDEPCHKILGYKTK